MNGMMNTMTAEEIWDATLAQVKATVDKQTFSTWFSKTSFASTEERAFIVHVENAFIRDMLEKRLTGMVERLLQAQTGDPASFEKECDFIANRMTELHKVGVPYKRNGHTV